MPAPGPGPCWWISPIHRWSYEHCRGAIAYGVHPVIGTTGLKPEQLE